jgi:hypothetical protein
MHIVDITAPKVSRDEKIAFTIALTLGVLLTLVMVT